MFSKVDIYDDVPSVVTVVHGGEIFTALAGQHPSFNLIVAKLANDPHDESVLELFDVQRTLSLAFQRVSPRITVANGEVFFDGDVLHNGVSKQILRFVDEGQMDRLEAVANFTEKVMTNPQEHSRDQLFTWLDRHNFTITKEGNFVGYKGCSDDNGTPVSTRTAPASDGVVRNNVSVAGERVKNLPGDVIEMPRSKVDFNAGVGCSNGLHVGTYAYASSFAPILLEVHVDPRDVVSVPTDCDAQKIRACRYTVIGPVEREYTTAVLDYDLDVDEEDDEFLYEDDVEDYEADEVTESTFEAGDRVLTTRYLLTHSFREIPVGSVGTVVESDEGDVFVKVDFDDYETNSWMVDAFEKVSEADQKKWDTRLNYTKQVRGPGGRFGPRQ